MGGGGWGFSQKFKIFGFWGKKIKNFAINFFLKKRGFFYKN